MAKNIIKRHRTLTGPVEEYVVADIPSDSDTNSNMIIELIKMNENNSNIKLDSINKKLDEFITNEKENNQSIKNEIKEAKSDFVSNTINPMHQLIKEHKESLNSILEKQKYYARKEELEKLETDIRDNIKAYQKRMFYFNACCILAYSYLLYCSDITINWKSILGLLKVFF